MSTTLEEMSPVIQSRDVAFGLNRRIAKTFKASQSGTETRRTSGVLERLGFIVCDLQMTVAELQRENQELKRQLQALTDLKAARKQLRYEQCVYWKYDETGNRVDGPFCPKCLDEGHVRPLMRGALSGLYRCVYHEALFASGAIGVAVQSSNA